MTPKHWFIAHFHLLAPPRKCVCVCPHSEETKANKINSHWAEALWLFLPSSLFFSSPSTSFIPIFPAFPSSTWLYLSLFHFIESTSVSHTWQRKWHHCVCPSPGSWRGGRPQSLHTEWCGPKIDKWTSGLGLRLSGEKGQDITSQRNSAFEIGL